MIDNKTPNKNYPVPHPDNIATTDVERIATALTMIDSDIQTCESEVNTAKIQINDIKSSSLRLPTDKIGVMNPELQNLSARKYIVINSDETGFTTVEGGGGQGGKQGEILIKKSDINFDTTWIDPRAVLKKSGNTTETISDTNIKTNDCIILKDTREQDNIEGISRQGISPRQATENIIADSFAGYIIKDEIEPQLEDSDIASKTKYGRVKIGNGINVENGTISIPEIGFASKDNFGLVRIGDGLNVVKGVVSIPESPKASREQFGTVKLSKDFAIGDAGELMLTAKNEAIIYQTSNVQACGNTIVIHENCAIYRLYINENTTINFSWDEITLKDDISFKVELYASDIYQITWADNITWEAFCVEVVPGKTVIEFKKMMYMPMIGDLLYQDKLPEKLLIRTTGEDCINLDYTCKSTGAGEYPAGTMVNNYDRDTWWSYDWLQGLDNIEAILQIDFMRLTWLNRIYYYCQRVSNVDYMYIEGSIDNITWIKLYSKLNCEIAGEYNFNLENKGYYRHYRIRCTSGLGISRLKFYGHDLDDRLYEFRQITPRMYTDSANGFVISSHAPVSEGTLSNITSTQTGLFAKFNTVDANNNWWIKYELPTAEIIDMIDYSTSTQSTDFNPIHFKIEASNDDISWDLLVDDNKKWLKCSNEQYFIDNKIAYKYYKLTVLNTLNATNCVIGRWRLYKQEKGIRYLENLVPEMLAQTQDGYEISADSQYNNDHKPFYAFDRKNGTQWAAANLPPSYLQIKFPSAVCCNAYSIQARFDQWYTQAPQDWELQGSNTGTSADWQTLDIEYGITFLQGETKIFDFHNEVSYQYYRLYVTKNGESTPHNVAFCEMQLGRLYRKYGINEQV